MLTIHRPTKWRQFYIALLEESSDKITQEQLFQEDFSESMGIFLSKQTNNTNWHFKKLSILINEKQLMHNHLLEIHFCYDNMWI